MAIKESEVVKKKAPAKRATPVKKTTAVKKTVAVKKATVKKATATKAVAKKTAAVKKTPARARSAAQKLADYRANQAERSTPLEEIAPPPPPVPDPLETLPYAAEPIAPSRRSTRGLIIGGAIAALAGLVAAAVLVLGGDKAPSKAAYIKQADNICRPANGPVAAIVKPTSYPEIATASGTFATTTSSQLGQLDRLKKPHGVDGKNATTALAALTATKVAATSLQNAATNKDDVASTSAAKDFKDKFAYATSVATTYGFTACTTGMQAGADAVSGGAHDVIKTNYVAKADAACRAGARDSDKLGNAPDSPAALVAYFDQALALYNKLLGDLKALPVPPGDEATVADMIGAQDAALAKLGEFRDAVKAQDGARVTAIEHELDPLTTAADAKFDAYGLAICGSNFGA